MTKVVVKDGNVEGALKRFKTGVAKSGVLSELKKKKHYVKPGDRRRLKKEEGIKNSHKKNRD